MAAERKTEKETVDRLVTFIREDADLDDLAAMLSKYCENGRLTVVGTDGGESDEFENGKRE